MKITREILIQASIQQVYGAYADIEGWKEVLDDVVDVQINYDDGIHQEFEMTVQRNNGHETVHSLRFCYPFSAIEIFQTKPPPLFETMYGVWQFTLKDNHVLVRASREFEIKKDYIFDSHILEKFLEKNLYLFKKWIENCKK